MLDQSPLSRLLVVVPISLLALVLASAQVRPERTRRLITQAVDESKRVELPGNTIPQADTGNDRGRVPDSLPNGAHAAPIAAAKGERRRTG